MAKLLLTVLALIAVTAAEPFVPLSYVDYSYVWPQLAAPAAPVVPTAYSSAYTATSYANTWPQVAAPASVLPTTYSSAYTNYAPAYSAAYTAPAYSAAYTAPAYSPYSAPLVLDPYFGVVVGKK